MDFYRLPPGLEPQVGRAPSRGVTPLGSRLGYDGRMSTDSRPRAWRVLWRVRGPRKTAVAALYRHPIGTELRIYIEPEERDDLLHSEVHANDIGILEERANDVRIVLRGQGWTESPAVTICRRISACELLTS